MDDMLEIELKLALTAEGVETLLASDMIREARPASSPLAATYFDTPEQDLRKAGYALRIRREGDRTVQTLKASGAAAGLFVRPEWECPIEGETPRFDVAAGPLGETMPAAVLARLAPIFTTAVERVTCHVRQGESAIELVVDRGAVTTGNERSTICEVELELKGGPAAALFAAARRIDAIAPVRLGVLSKSDRGYLLAAGQMASPVKAAPVALAPDMTAAAAFQAIAQSCIQQFRLNEDLLALRSNPAMLHQARVGLRRLRSAFSLFKPLFVDDAQVDHLREGLRWIAATLGDARDIDVLAARIGDAEAAVRLEQARDDAYAAVEAALASPRHRHLMLDLVEWLAIGPWLARAETAALRDRPIPDMAHTMLDKHRKRLKKGGRRVAKLDDERRHEVRIEAKKLRYATEFFGSLYTGKKVRRRWERFLRALEALQGHLGDLNDDATAPRLLAMIGLEAAPATTPVDRDKLLAKAEDAYEELIDTKRFWH